MTIEEKRRELFEVHFSIPDGAEFNGAHYMGGISSTGLTIVNIQWHAFNAALDSVIIGLPALQRLVTWDDQSADIYWPDEIVAAIHAAGVSTK